MKIRNLFALLLLLFALTVNGQTFGGATFNATTFNGTASVSPPANQFTTTQMGGGLSVTGHRSTDALGYILNVTNGVTVGIVVAGRFEIKNAASDATDVLDLSIGPGGDTSGQITNQGDGIVVGYAMFFVIPPGLLPGKAYFYKITVTDVSNKTTLFTGTIRML